MNQRPMGLSDSTESLLGARGMMLDCEWWVDGPEGRSSITLRLRLLTRNKEFRLEKLYSIKELADMVDVRGLLDATVTDMIAELASFIKEAANEL